MDVVTLLLAKEYADQLVRGKGAIAGKSAYEIAQENGYTGSVTEWLQSLKGEPGPAGSAVPAIEHKKGDYDIEKITVLDDNGEPIRDENGEYINIIDYISNIVTNPENTKILKGGKKVTSVNEEITLYPNQFYFFTNNFTSLTITLAEPANNDIVNEYCFMFNTGDEIPVLTFPESVLLPADFKIEANKRYKIKILENCLSIQSWNLK
jgi:hypothetical protein